MDAAFDGQRELPSHRVATDEEVARILSDPHSKDFQDLRDRAAYVYVTGSLPTHLRTLMNSLLRKVTNYSRQPVSLDGRLGSLQLDPGTIEALSLNTHPLIKKVNEYLRQGYRISVVREHQTRRPYSKVLLINGRTGDRLTVQADGSVKDSWN